MSVDLTRPLVPSMGQHDPLDGFVTYSGLHLTATKVSGLPVHTGLAHEITDMAGICRGVRMVTDDPLGIGGLLCDATKLTLMMSGGGPTHAGLLKSTLDAALTGLDAFTGSGSLAPGQEPPCVPGVWAVHWSFRNRKNDGMDREKPGFICQDRFPGSTHQGPPGIYATEGTDRRILAGRKKPEGRDLGGTWRLTR